MVPLLQWLTFDFCEYHIEVAFRGGVSFPQFSMEADLDQIRRNTMGINRTDSRLCFDETITKYLLRKIPNLEPITECRLGVEMITPYL
jgi:hypothetical protein